MGDATRVTKEPGSLAFTDIGSLFGRSRWWGPRLWNPMASRSMFLETCSTSRAGCAMWRRASEFAITETTVKQHIALSGYQKVPLHTQHHLKTKPMHSTLFLSHEPKSKDVAFDGKLSIQGDRIVLSVHMYASALSCFMSVCGQTFVFCMFLFCTQFLYNASCR